MSDILGPAALAGLGHLRLVLFIAGRVLPAQGGEAPAQLRRGQGQMRRHAAPDRADQEGQARSHPHIDAHHMLAIGPVDDDDMAVLGDAPQRDQHVVVQRQPLDLRPDQIQIAGADQPGRQLRHGEAQRVGLVGLVEADEARPRHGAQDAEAGAGADAGRARHGGDAQRPRRGGQMLQDAQRMHDRADILMLFPHMLFNRVCHSTLRLQF